VATLEDALEAFRAAQARVPEAEAAAKTLIADARAGVEQARADRDAAIVAEAMAGVAQVDIIRRTGMGRESIRRILRAGGVEPD
jgi:hypothetical protein